MLMDETKFFAQTRYLVSPFFIRFPTQQIQEKNASEDLCKFLKGNEQLELQLSDYHKA